MRGKLAGAVAAAIAIVLLAGCGGGDDGDAATTTTAADAGPTKADASAHLLRLEDVLSDDSLDAPWEAGDAAADVPIELPTCIDESTVATDATAVAKFVTVNDFSVPAVDEQVTAFVDDAAAAEAFDAAVERLDGCGSSEFVYDGTPSPATTVRLDLPALGERSQAWRTTSEIAGSKINITTVHLLVGDLEASIVHTAIGEPNPVELDRILQNAVARLG